MAGLPALLGGVIVVLVGLLVLVQPAVFVFASASESTARWLEKTDYRANGIGLDTLVRLVAASAMLTVGWRLGRWGADRLAGIRSRGALPAARGPGRGTVLYAASRMLLGGISLLSALMLVGFDDLAVQCHRAPGSLPGWLHDDWFNKLAVDCKRGYPDVLFHVLTDLPLLTALLFVAIATLRRGIVATRQILPGASGKPAITRADPAEQLS